MLSADLKEHARRSRRDHRRADAPEEPRGVGSTSSPRSRRRATAWSPPAPWRVRKAVRRQGSGPDRDAQDVLQIPVAASNAASVTLGDVATIKPTFKDATSITRVVGHAAVYRCVGDTGRLLDAADSVEREPCRSDQRPARLFQGHEVKVINDESKTIRQLLADLQNSVLTGVLLVFVIILFVLGGRASIFIGIAIPVSFLTGILGLNLFGLTMNIVVLFSLILAVGMLVDDAIIVSEFAERRMSEGMKPREAYAFAASRMSGPVVALTHRGLFAAPLLAGHRQPVHNMPITLIATLSASLVSALIFTPTR
jgi:multidrug efflux pump